MKVIEQNILSVEKGIICQQVNCQGAMNSGLAKSIRNKWPIVYEDYMFTVSKIKPDFARLGFVSTIKVTENLTVANIFGQLNYGYDGKRYTDYGALNYAFSRISPRFLKNAGWEQDIYFPFNFGCDRGGADWNIVSKMIEYYFPDAIICKLPPKVS